MNLNTEEYTVLMQAINNARAEIADDTFIDPYGYTNESLSKALDSAESKIMANESRFTCLVLMRDDFEKEGYDCSSLSDERMQEIANEIGDGCMDIFWSEIAFFTGKHDLPKLK